MSEYNQPFGYTQKTIQVTVNLDEYTELVARSFAITKALPPSPELYVKYLIENEIKRIKNIEAEQAPVGDDREINPETGEFVDEQVN